MRGVIVRFDADKGYGFIRSSEASRDVFVHISDVPGHSSLRSGQTVRFDPVDTAKGVQARNVVVGRQQARPDLRASVIGLGVAIVVTVVAVVVGLPWFVSWVVALSLVTFAVYGIDKIQARNDGFRTPEVTLHLLALVGGSPGALAGQRVFRHKTRKVPFQVVFWITVAVQVAIVAVYLALR